MRARLVLCGLTLAVCIPSGSHAQSRVLNPLSDDDTATFYHLPEGGAVMPLAWYRSLEVVDSTTGQSTGQTFADRMTEYGFLDDPASDLPVGFGVVSLDFLAGLQGLSINCAACHVGEIQAGPTLLRINGGPNQADVRRFSQDVYASILAALGVPARVMRLLAQSDRLQPETMVLLDRVGFVPAGDFELAPHSAEAEEFAKVVHELVRSSRSTPTARSAARGLAPSAAPGLPDVAGNLELLVAEAQYFTAQGRFPLSTREGYGRLDAFATVRFLLFPRESREFPFTAPVSVPHLWGLDKKKWLHWNNNTNSTMQRNISQALGMGAVQGPSGVHNVLLPNVNSLETIAQHIAPPPWPADVFGPLDDLLVERGAEVYEQRCASCHDAGTVDPASGLLEFPLFTLSQTGTDANYALNFHLPVDDVSFPAALGERMQQLETWYYERRDRRHPVPVETQNEWSGGSARLPAIWRDPLQNDVEAPVYAALPLTGVWATAPYLHNNSVPTLRDLLKPAAERPVEFQAGHRDYDPVNVGYVQPADPESIRTLLRFDTRDAGNSNGGHEGALFGSDDISSEDIAALLEYLKSL